MHLTVEPPWAELAMREAEKAFMLEIGSADRLSAKAERLVAAAALAVGLPLLGPVDATSLGSLPEPVRQLFIAAALLFGIAVALSLFAVRTRRYKTYPADSELIEALQRASEGGVGAHLQMAGIYLKARASNRAVNARRATLLGWSSAMIVVGFALVVVAQVARIAP